MVLKIKDYEAVRVLLQKGQKRVLSNIISLRSGSINKSVDANSISFLI